MNRGKPWLRSYAPGVPHEIDIEEITLSRALSRSAAERGDMTALNYMGRKISFRELKFLVKQICPGLKGAGGGEGDKVATLLPNLPQMIIAVYAFRIGQSSCPTTPPTPSGAGLPARRFESRVAVAWICCCPACSP